MKRKNHTRTETLLIKLQLKKLKKRNRIRIKISLSSCKLSLLKNNKITNCFRKTPYVCNLKTQQKFVRKILGIIGYKKDFLLDLNQLTNTPIELAESIEQMRIIESEFSLYSVDVSPSLPSINEPHEVNIVLDYLKSNKEQQIFLKKIISND